MKKTISRIICICIVLCLAVTMAYAQDGVPGVVMQGVDSVVRIEADYSDGYATGSGFVVKSDKNGTIIVTNAHVVEDDPTSIKIWLSDTESVSARILAISSQQDLCILELANPVQYLKALTIASKDAERGNAVYAVGFPAAGDYLSNTDAKGSDAATITNGIVGAVRQLSVAPFGPAMTLLQVNAAINSGNSGGPLFNSEGVVVGVNTFKILDSEGIFGSIAASELLAYLAANGIQAATDSLAASSNLGYIIGGAVAAVAAVAVVVLLLVKKKKSRPAPVEEKTVTLREYMAMRSEPLSEEEAVSFLMPVVLELRKVHDNGKCHLEVSPDSITVKGQAAALKPSVGMEAARYCSGFAAPEIYSGTSCGIASDVYSLCAVLSFLVNGTVPENALKRSADAEDAESGLQAIISKGMALDADQRFAAVQELVYTLAPYNTGVLPQVSVAAPTDTIPEALAEAPTPAPQKKERRKLPMKWVAAIAVLALLISIGAASGWVYSRYSSAIALAEAGEYRQARETIVLPAVISLFDQPLDDYLQAGTMLEDRQYNEAKDAFDSLGNYRDSENLSMTAQYRLATQIADSGDFDAAIEIFTALAEKEFMDSANRVLETRFRKASYVLYELRDFKTAKEQFEELLTDSYPGAADMVNESVLLWAVQETQDRNYTAAMRKLVGLGEYPGAPEALTQLKEQMYLEAIDAYRKDDSVLAWELFGQISKYKRSSDYLFLLKSFSWYISDSDYAHLLKLIDFEDAAIHLVSTQSVAKRFLLGTWESLDGEFDFALKSDGSISYHLPWFDYGDYYKIEDGNILLYPEGNEKNTRTLFSLTVISQNCVDFYCWKDGSTHRLYRQ